MSKNTQQEMEEDVFKKAHVLHHICVPEDKTMWIHKREALKVVQQELTRQKEEFIAILKHIHEDKPEDEVHCTCLGYAIDILAQDSEDGKENYRRILTLLK